MVRNKQLGEKVRNFMGMELATFRLRAGSSEEQLITAAKKMAEGLYAGEEGFLGHTILKGKDGIYVDVVFATSQQEAERLCGKWGRGPFAESCLAYLEAIEPGSANIAFFERLH